MAAEDTRPNATAGPTRIDVGAYLINATSLDEQTQSFGADFYVTFSWLDPRLADPKANGLRTAPLDTVWHPRLLPVNRKSTELVYPAVVEVSPEGRVRYTQRLVGTFTVPLALRDFPFDKQLLYLEIVTPGLSPRDVTFASDADYFGVERDLAIRGWDVERPVLDVFTKKLSADSGRVVELSGMRIQMEAVRNWRYYVLREILPLVFIVLMAQSLFWLPPTEHGMKVGISTAAIFSLMAYYVQLGRSMPKLDYLTRMDWFVVGSTVLVFLSFAQVVYGMYMIKRDKLEPIRKQECWARAWYPLALLGVCVWAFY